MKKWSLELLQNCAEYNDMHATQQILDKSEEPGQPINRMIVNRMSMPIG